MRKFVITLLLLVLFAIVMSGVWVLGGRRISLFVDRFRTVEAAVTPVQRISYQGSGTGGILQINDLALSLASPEKQGPSPEIGTTKTGDLALSFNKKVFPFGPLQPTPVNGEEALAAKRPNRDKAFITVRRSALAWPTLLDFNFMTGQSPSWKRHQYYDLTWTKESGARLELIWRYEQYFYPSQGWVSGLMTREGETGLIRVDISDNAR
jgi:hypothetical protein